MLCKEKTKRGWEISSNPFRPHRLLTPGQLLHEVGVLRQLVKRNYWIIEEGGFHTLLNHPRALQLKQSEAHILREKNKQIKPPLDFIPERLCSNKAGVVISCRQLVLVTDCLWTPHKDVSAKNFKLAAKWNTTQKGRGGGIHSADFKTKAARDLHFKWNLHLSRDALTGKDWRSSLLKWVCVTTRRKTKQCSNSTLLYISSKCASPTDLFNLANRKWP